MGILVLVLCGLALALAFLVAIYLKLDGLVLRLLAVIRREREEGESRAITSLTGAAARAAAERRSEADEGEPEEEPTQVVSRPVAGTPAAPNGLRLSSRAAIPPPPASRRVGER